MLDQIESKYMSDIIRKDHKKLADIQGVYVQKVFNKYKEKIELKILIHDQFGYNFSFIGFTGAYFFPAVMWYVQSYKHTKDDIIDLLNSSTINLSDLEIRIFQIITNNLGFRKGYSIELLESLIFFSSYFSNFKSELESDFLGKTFINNYIPKYYNSFSYDIFKKNLTLVNETIQPFILPDNNFWNLGSILLDEDDLNFKINDQYNVFPQWLIEENNKPVLILHRISPVQFKNNFIYKKNIVNSITYFVNFNYFTKTNGELYNFYLPDLFEAFDMLENQNSIAHKINSFKYEVNPSWELSINYPKKLNNLQSLLDKNERDEINNFILNNLDIIIFLFNSNRSFESINIQKIMTSFERKNIFNRLFVKRLRIDKINLTQYILVLTKFDKNKQMKFKNKIKQIFLSIFPTGVIIDYNSGLAFYLYINSETKKNNFQNIIDFLKFVDVDFKIYGDIINHGFLAYTFPASEYFIGDNWIFPNYDLTIKPKIFQNISKLVLEKERKYYEKEEKKNRIKEFEQFIGKI